MMMDQRKSEIPQISDRIYQEIRKNFIGLKYNNTNTEAGFLYVWYHQDRNFYYRLNNPSDWRKGQLNKLCFFDYWLKLKGFDDKKRSLIWEKLKSDYGLAIDKDFEDSDYLKKTIKQYEQNKTLKEYYHELIFQRKIKKKTWEDLRKELIDKPWEKESDKRLKKALKLYRKIHDYLKINPHARPREIQRKFSINKSQLKAILDSMNPKKSQSQFLWAGF